MKQNADIKIESHREVSKIGNGILFHSFPGALYVVSMYIYTTFTKEKNVFPCQRREHRVQIEFQMIIGMYPLQKIQYLLHIGAAAAYSPSGVVNS